MILKNRLILETDNYVANPGYFLQHESIAVAQKENKSKKLSRSL